MPVNSRYFNNSIWLLMYRLITAFMHLLFNVVIARLYHGEVFGTINYTLSIVSILGVFTALGLESILIDEFSKNQKEKETILTTSLMLRAGVSLITILLVFVFFAFCAPIDSFSEHILKIQVWMLFAQSFEVVNSWLISESKSKVNVRNTAVSQFICSIFQILALVFWNSIEWYVALTVVQTLGIGILNLLYFNKNKTLKYKWDFAAAKNLLNRSYHLILTNFTIVLYTQLDKIMIEGFTSRVEVANYSVAVSLCNIWGFIPLAFANSYAPKIFILKKEKPRQEYESALIRLWSMVFGMSIMFAGIMFVFSQLIVLMLYGSEYEKAIPLLRILSISNFFAVLGSVRGSTWIIAENKQKYSKYYCVFGTVLNILLNYLLIPHIGGTGAAIATLSTEIMVAVIAPLFFSETRKFVVLLLKSFHNIPGMTRELFLQVTRRIKHE